LEVLLHRTYSVIGHQKTINSYDIIRGDRFVIRRNARITPLSSPVDGGVLRNDRQNLTNRKRRPSLLTISPNLSDMPTNVNDNSLTTVADDTQACSPKRSCSHASESCNLSPIVGESKTRSCRDKMKNQPEVTNGPVITDDEKNSILEPIVNGTTVKNYKKPKISNVFEEMEMEYEEYIPRKSKNHKKKQSQGNRKFNHVKSLVNPKLKPKR